MGNFPKLTADQLTPWDTRFEAVAELVEEVLRRAEKTTESTARATTIASLAKNLQIFGSSQFDFFRGRLERDDTLQLLSNVSKADFSEYLTIDYPIPEFILSTIIQQIAHDALVLQRIVDQHNPMSQMVTLRESDKLANLAIASLPEKPAGWNKDPVAPVALTYLQRDMNVRIVPYGPVALIGVPATSIKQDRDLLAVAHELGHYLYWHGKNEASEYYVDLIDEKRPPAADSMDREQWSPNLIWHWAEEIFADIISLIIAGPVAGYAMLEKQEEAVGFHFIKDQGVHPPSAIRPYIHALALVELNKKFHLPHLDAAGFKLTEKWNSIRSRRSVPSAIDIEKIKDQKLEWFSLDTAFLGQGALSPDKENSLQQIIETVIDVLPPAWIQERFEPTSLFTQKAWSQQLDIDDPYSEMNEWFTRFRTEKDENGQDIQFPDIAEYATVEGDDLWRNLAEDRGYKNPGEDIPEPVRPEIWLEIVRFAGWTTKGPTGRAH